jgi:tetratricopeptide (TPR) repeat protein
MWFGVGMTIGWLSSPGDTVIYNNPYWEAPPTIVVDYSQPIPAPDQDQAASAFPPAPDEAAIDADEGLPTTAPPAPEPNDSAKAANRLFDDARELFKGGKYADAQDKVERAIKELPSDATLHEFRALTLFAQAKYKDAAAGLYAVLAAGPGWDWDTMKFLYGDANVYTTQLRALEEFAKVNPKADYAYFLLAYQYLVLGSKESALQMLNVVVRLQPNDKLAAALIKALTTKEGDAAPATSKP